MIDLSSQKNKEIIKKDFNLRFTTVFLGAFNVILVVYLVLILPTYFNLKVHSLDVKGRLEVSQQEYKMKKGGDLKEQYDASKAKIRALDSLNKYEVSKLFKDLNKLGDKNTEILSFLYENKKEDSSFVLSGISSNRDTIVGFINEVKSSGNFSKVDFPISGLAKNSGLEFSLNIKLK